VGTIVAGNSEVTPRCTRTPPAHAEEEPPMDPAFVRASKFTLTARRYRAVEDLRARFTETAILARAKAGTLCDCERDTACELETVAYLLGEGNPGHE
jgi:hypothetical protein